MEMTAAALRHRYTATSWTRRRKLHLLFTKMPFLYFACPFWDSLRDRDAPLLKHKHHRTVIKPSPYITMTLNDMPDSYIRSCNYAPHSSDPSLLQEQLHSYFTPLWIQPSVECPVVHHRVEPLDRLLRPTDPVYRHHLRGFAQAGNMR